MIKLQNPAFIAIDTDLLVQRKINKIVIDYVTVLTLKEIVITPSEPIFDNENNQIGETPATTQTVNQCVVKTWINDENGNRIFDEKNLFELESFNDKNILKELHQYFLNKIQLLNPQIDFQLSTTFK